MKDKIILECLKKGCPRKVKIDFDKESMPKGTVRIKSYCPWHILQEGKEYLESCYDSKGKIIKEE